MNRPTNEPADPANVEMAATGGLKLSPLECLRAAEAQYPEAWSRVQQFYDIRGVTLQAWPAWCFLPLAGWYAIVSAATGSESLPLSWMNEVASLAAIGSWRYTQSIYRYDSDLIHSLIHHPYRKSKRFPSFMRLPEWCVYVETAGQQWQNDTLHGFWAHLEWDSKTHHRELRMLLNTGSDLVPFALHLGPWALSEALARVVRRAQTHAKYYETTGALDAATADQQLGDLKQSIQPLLALLEHLCRDPVVDAHEHEGPYKIFLRDQNKRLRSHLHAPNQPRVWHVRKAL